MTAGLHHPVVWLRWIISNTRRLLILLAGVSILGAGLAMLVLPGPGMLVIVAGLAVLATEFAWAERMLDRTRSRAGDATTALTATRTGQAAFAVSAIALITGGAAVAALVDGHRIVGITTFVSGVCALALLVPSVQRRINQPRIPRSTPTAAPATHQGSQRLHADDATSTKGTPT
jgi:hypothetical protein